MFLDRGYKESQAYFRGGFYANLHIDSTRFFFINSRGGPSIKKGGLIPLFPTRTGSNRFQRGFKGCFFLPEWNSTSSQSGPSNRIAIFN